MSRCESCGKKVEYELITLSADPYAPGLCYECLPEDTREAYDKFCDSMNSKNTVDTKNPSEPGLDASQGEVLDGQPREIH